MRPKQLSTHLGSETVLGRAGRRGQRGGRDGREAVAPRVTEAAVHSSRAALGRPLLPGGDSADGPSMRAVSAARKPSQLLPLTPNTGKRGPCAAAEGC